MFSFKLEPDIPLLTVTRTGFWSLDTVVSYEAALRFELAKLKLAGSPTAFIVDIRSSGAQPKEVADALTSMVAGLGPLNADRTAVVTASGIAKLQAKRIAITTSQVFTSLVLARDWVIASIDPNAAAKTVHNEPSSAEAEGSLVHLRGPSNVDVMFTPTAALETAKHIGEAARKALTRPPRSSMAMSANKLAQT